MIASERKGTRLIKYSVACARIFKHFVASTLHCFSMSFWVIFVSDLMSFCVVFCRVDFVCRQCGAIDDMLTLQLQYSVMQIMLWFVLMLFYILRRCFPLCFNLVLVHLASSWVIFELSCSFLVHCVSEQFIGFISKLHFYDDTHILRNHVCPLAATFTSRNITFFLRALRALTIFLCWCRGLMDTL